MIDNRDMTRQLEKSDSSLKVYGSLLNEIGVSLDAAVEVDNLPEHSLTVKILGRFKIPGSGNMIYRKGILNICDCIRKKVLYQSV